MKLRKIKETILVKVFSKKDAKELLQILYENGYNANNSCLLDPDNYWSMDGSHMNYVIYPNKRVTCSSCDSNVFPQFALKAFKHKYIMREIKELKINIPEGYEIDRTNSTFECIKFKPKSLTYDDIEATLLENHYSSIKCEIKATSILQLNKLLTINKLMNVAKYLNGDWKPDWEDGKAKWVIYITMDNNIRVSYSCGSRNISAYFKTKDLAEQAIDILGEDTIRLALSTDW